MDDQQTLEVDLQENLLSFRNDTLNLLLLICMGLSATWLVLLLSRINRQLTEIVAPFFPWAVFTLSIVAAWAVFRRGHQALARAMFFTAIILAPSLSMLILPQDLSFMAYSLLLSVILSGVLISPRAPFGLASICLAVFITIGLLNLFGLITPPMFTGFGHYLSLFGGPAIMLFLVALVGWLATRDLVSSVTWAMESNRLAERRAARLAASEARAARTLLELEGSYDVQSRLNAQLQLLNAELAQARTVADEANTLKTRFLANMSHELRTPLNAIINFTQFLGKPRYGELTPRQVELQERVLVNSEHLLGLINDILDLSKIEAGRMELHLEALDLEPIFHGVMATAVGLTKSKGLLLETDVEEELPQVRGDKVRVRQILLNLISNAAKFTDTGSITLRAFERDGVVQVSISDTGSGIPARELPLIFEEFHQVEQAASSRRQQGTGLGLPISRRLVLLQGGDMWAESEIDAGSTFSFTLPIVHDFAPEVLIFDPEEQTAA
ncbi:MAG TPA: ATP-binding protein [Herpetosiphonaceae bacterium]|nr:ATP-binding protein [Herpetosiphonaceae bacterium]